MKYKFNFLLIIIFCLPCSCLAQLFSVIDFKEIKKNETPKEYRAILIVGSGVTENRFLFDEIVEPLSKKISKKAITTEILFMPTSENDENNNTEILNQQLLKKEYDAVFFIMPNRTSITTIHEYSLQVSPPVVSRINSHSRGNSTLNFRIFDIKNLRDEVWMATMNINVELASRNAYRRISNIIIESLVNNHLCKR
ncbi:MAG TPA: hypothetical protein VHP12_02955 [Chitinophagaceae bacterium]|nr:hypothetical protein [Chitinophagaceae bacterium]